MDMNDYQEKAVKTAIYPEVAVVKEHELAYPVNFTYPLLGFAGEVGEICNKLKKVIRDNTPINSEDMKAELGDCLWYLAVLANECGVDLNDIAEYNLEKLADRTKRGVISGEGDRR